MRVRAPKQRLAEIWGDRHHRSPTLLLMALGCAALLAGGWQGWRTADFLGHATAAAGIVVDPDQHQTVRFTAADGATVVFVQNGHLALPRGAAVPVVYDPHDPGGTARAGTFAALWSDPIGFALGGAGLILLPLLGFNASWNWQRR